MRFLNENRVRDAIRVGEWLSLLVGLPVLLPAMWRRGNRVYCGLNRETGVGWFR